MRGKPAKDFKPAMINSKRFLLSYLQNFWTTHGCVRTVQVRTVTVDKTVAKLTVLNCLMLKHLDTLLILLSERLAIDSIMLILLG